MDLLAPLPELETASKAIGARPTVAGDGVDISGWVVGGKFALSNCIAYIEGDGADRLVTSPVAGATAFGVEVWTFKATKAGTLRWCLVGYLNNGADILAVAAGGFAQILEGVAVGSRLAIAGLPNGGIPTYRFEPVEHAFDARRMGA